MILSQSGGLVSICLSNSSVLRVIEFHSSSTLHHVLESADLLHVGATGCAEVARLRALLAWVSLLSNAWCHIISLVLINCSCSLAWASCLRKGPSWEVLLVWRVRWSFGNIAAWADWSRCGSLGLETTSTTEAEGVLWWLLILKALSGQVLRTGGSFNWVELHLLANR